jgi:hypothetical protein
MADPRTELADIIVPARARNRDCGRQRLLPWGAAAVACAALHRGGAWLWHRRRPLRCDAMAVAAAQQRTVMQALAARLDAWARARFRLARVDAAHCPAGLDAAAWSELGQDTEQLRFAAPQPDGFAELAALCDRARLGTPCLWSLPHA